MNLGNDMLILYDFTWNNYEIFVATAPTYGKYLVFKYEMVWFRDFSQ